MSPSPSASSRAELAERLLRQNRLDLLAVLRRLAVARHGRPAPDDGRRSRPGSSSRLRSTNSAPFRKIPRVLAGDRKLRLRDHLLQRRARQRRTSAAPPLSGSVGKSSRGSVCIRESKRSAATFTPLLSSAMRMSVSGKRLDDLVELLRRQRQRPGFRDRRRALAAQRRLRDRSREICTSSPLASISTLARIGIVFLRSTMPWKSCSSRRRSFLRTTSSMAVLTSKRAGMRARDPLRRGEIRE